MLWGILAAVSFLACAAKFVAHRIHRPDIDKLFLKLHVVFGSLLPIAAAIHTVLMFKRPHRLREAATGLCMDAGIIGLMVSHFFAMQMGAKAMPMHRFSTVFTGVGVIAHALTHK